MLGLMRRRNTLAFKVAGNGHYIHLGFWGVLLNDTERGARCLSYLTSKIEKQVLWPNSKPGTWCAQDKPLRGTKGSLCFSQTFGDEQ